VIWKVDSTRLAIECHVAGWTTHTQSATQLNTTTFIRAWVYSKPNINFFSRTQTRPSFVPPTEQPNITIEWRLCILQSVVVLVCNFLYSLTRLYFLAFRSSKAAHKSFWKAIRHGRQYVMKGFSFTKFVAPY